MQTDEFPPNLRKTERKQLKLKLNEVSKILNYVATENIIPTSRLLKVARYVVARKLGFKTKLAKPQKPRYKKIINKS